METISIERAFDYIKRLRLYETSSQVAFFISSLALFSQRITVELFGYQDFIPFFNALVVTLFIWFIAFIVIRKLLSHFNKFVLNMISKKQVYHEIKFKTDAVTRLNDEWDSQGHISLSEKGLLITASNSGVLIKPKKKWIFLIGRVWKNFKATMVVDFDSMVGIDTQADQKSDIVIPQIPVWVSIERNFRKILGVIFRAENFENYYMIEFWKINDCVYIKPHVRVNGSWDIPWVNMPNFKSKVKRSYDEVKIVLEVEDGVARIRIDDGKSYYLKLPTQYEINLGKSNGKDTVDIDHFIRKIVNEIPFNDKAGRFGFRNYPNEAAVIKSLKIDPITKISG